MAGIRLLLLISLLLGLFSALPTAWAQDMPPCLVQKINAAAPSPDFDADRDRFLGSMNLTWRGIVAGLTPEQIATYTVVFCEQAVVTNQGDPDGDGYSEILLEYPPTDAVSSGNNAPAPTRPPDTAPTAVPAQQNNTPAPTKAPFAAPTIAPTPVPPLPGKEEKSGAVLFESDMSTVPKELVIDSDAEGETLTENSVEFLHFEIANQLTLYLPEGADWADYAIEARLRLGGGALILTGRSADNLCEGYDFFVDPRDGEAQLRVTDADCESTTLEDINGSGVQENTWMDVRLEVNGQQIAAYIDGQQVLVTTDKTFEQGFPALYVIMDEGDQAVLDLDSLRVEEIAAAPSVLTAYAASPEEALAELQRLNIVPAGGERVFYEDSAYFTGQGSWFQPLASRAPRRDIVMAGELTFTSASVDDFETCSLMARVVINDNTGSAVEYVEFGLDSDGDVYLADYASPSESMTTLEYAPAPLTVSAPHHFLFVGFGETASLYVNGALMFEDIGIEARTGSFGIGLIGKAPGSRCEGRNIWVYSFD